MALASVYYAIHTPSRVYQPARRLARSHLLGASLPSIMLLCSSVISWKAVVAVGSISFSKENSVQKVTADENSKKSCAADLLRLLGNNSSDVAIDRNRASELRKCIRPLISVPSSRDNGVRTKIKRSSSPLNFKGIENERSNRWPLDGRECSPELNASNGVRDWTMLREIYEQKEYDYSQRKAVGRREGAFHKSRKTPTVNRDVVDDLIKFPPSAVMKMAEASVRSGADPSFIDAFLSPTQIDVPDVEGGFAASCHPTKYPKCQRFVDRTLNQYFSFLFEAIACRSYPFLGVSFSLDRFDLFHGHIFTAFGSGQLGILFHAREFPAEDSTTFPYNLGYCQIGTTVKYDSGMNLRNLLWVPPLVSENDSAIVSSNDLKQPVRRGGTPPSGMLCALDTSPDTICYRELVDDWLKLVRTVYEGDFGNIVADISYFASLSDRPPEDRLFIC